MKLRLTLFNFFAVTGLAFGQAQQTNTFGRNIDTPAERQSFREALELWTDDSPTFLNGTYTGYLTVDTNTLHVDSANNKVGIGTTNPTTLSNIGLHIYNISSAGFALQNSLNKWDHLVQGGTGKYGLYSSTLANYAFMVEPNGNFQIKNGLSIDGGNFVLDQGTAGGTTGQFRIVDDYGSQIIGAQNAGEFAFYIDNDASGTETAGDVPLLGFSYGGQSLYLGGSSTNSPTVQVANGYVDLQGTPIISGNFSASGQVELTGQAASTDDSAMTKGLVRDFSSVWGNVYKYSNGETDTNNKLNMVYAGDRYFNFSCYTGTAAGDGQWTTFHSQTFGLTYGSGAKGQLRDSFSYKFKLDSNTVTNTDVDLWLIRGKTANATLPVASDVCFALKFAGEEDLMIAVYDGVTAHTTTIDVSTINSWFTNLASQQEFMWTWDGTTAKVFGRYRKPAGTGDNDWSIWYTIGSLTPSGMSAGTTNLSFAGLHFLQHTPVTCTSYTKNFIIWDLEHTTNVIAPN